MDYLSSLKLVQRGGNCTKQSMDILVSSHDSRKCRKKDVRERKDVISKLPDGILLHILSFISTKDAIRTSILARRWKLLWTYLSDFNLQPCLAGKNRTEDEITGKNFFNLVDRLLQNVKYIKRFHFDTFGIPVDAEQTNSWISALLKYKIEELYLSLDVRSSFVLADNLFAPESLNVLDLDVRFGFEIPCCLYFPSLKTLKLSCVNFSDETSAQQLFSGCPLLQKLTLISCNWKIKNVSIKIPTLTTLMIGDREDSYWESVSSCICKVMIDVVNLISLSCTNYLRVELVPINITSLVEASIDLSSRFRYVARPIKLLSGICHVKSLKLSDKTVLILSRAENLVSLLPMFHILTHICVEMGLFHHTVQTLMDVLEKSPNLEALHIAVIEVDSDLESDLNEEDGILNRIPHCFKSSLKSLSISYFDQSAAEMEFLNFVLKNATFLERIKLFCLWPLSKKLKKQAKIRKQLQIMRRGLASCAIEFHPNSSCAIEFHPNASCAIEF